MPSVEKFDSEGAPLPKAQRYFAIFKPKGSKTLFANIVLPDGHKEKWDTRATERYVAVGAARTYVKVLCKGRGVLTKSEERAKRGEVSPHVKTRLNNEARAAGKPLPYPDPRGYRDGRGGIVAAEEVKPRRGRPPGTKKKTNGHVAALVPIVASPGEDGQEWRGFLGRHQDRCVVFFHRISELLIAHADEDPATFVATLRGMVVESYENTWRKPRGRAPA